MGAPKLEVPKQEHAKNLQNHEITGKNSIHSKQMKLKDKQGK